MTFTDVQKVRIEVADTEPGLYFLDDSEIEYLLEKNNNNVSRASIDAARCILLRMSTRGNESVDVFSFSGSKAAEQYRLALKLYLDNPYLNPILVSGVQARLGGTKFSEMNTNVSDPDNNSICPPERNQRASTEQNYF